MVVSTNVFHGICSVRPWWLNADQCEMAAGWTSAMATSYSWTGATPGTV